MKGEVPMSPMNKYPYELSRFFQGASEVEDCPQKRFVLDKVELEAIIESYVETLEK